jgi:hypothetical protein
MQLALGGTVYEYLSSWTPLFPKQFIRVGLACEVYTIEGLKSLKDKGEELPDPDFNSWIGKSCVAKIAHKKRFNDATKIDPSIGWEYYMLNSPEAKEANVILNMDVLDASLAVTPQVELMF